MGIQVCTILKRDPSVLAPGHIVNCSLSVSYDLFCAVCEPDLFVNRTQVEEYHFCPSYHNAYIPASITLDGMIFPIAEAYEIFCNTKCLASFLLGNITIQFPLIQQSSSIGPLASRHGFIIAPVTTGGPPGVHPSYMGPYPGRGVGPGTTGFATCSRTARCIASNLTAFVMYMGVVNVQKNPQATIDQIEQQLLARGQKIATRWPPVVSGGNLVVPNAKYTTPPTNTQLQAAAQSVQSLFGSIQSHGLSPKVDLSNEKPSEAAMIMKTGRPNISYEDYQHFLKGEPGWTMPKSGIMIPGQPGDIIESEVREDDYNDVYRW